MNQVKKIATHDGRFHTDEVLAIAALQLLYPRAEIIRTRDEAILAGCDIRVDVGRRYDPTTGDFDHHQGNAGTRENGIPYSSFGLVWKTYGSMITESEEAAQFIEKALVHSVDARDNGQKLSVPTTGPTGELVYGGVMPFEFADAIDAFNLCWNEDSDPDEAFHQALGVAHWMLSRLIRRARSMAPAKELVRAAIANAEDPRIIILAQGCPWQEVVITEAPEAVFMVIADDVGGKWRVECISTRAVGKHAYRKTLPEAWRDLDQAAFAAATGVPDAYFVHRQLFICVAKSFEGAIALAKLALAA